jgi:hypothetical protein
MKTKTIHLKTIQNRDTVDGKPFTYRVIKIANSTEYAPGDFLNKAAVDELCAAKEWQVLVFPGA